MAERILQYIGSPFTNPADAGPPTRIGAGSAEPTRWRYVRVQGTITCDGYGNGEIIWLPDPLNWPVPILQSDILPVPNPTYPQTEAQMQQIVNGVQNMFTQTETTYPGLMGQLTADPPCGQRFAGGGVRVWSLAGELTPTGIIRVAPVDSGLLHRVIMGNSDRHAFTTCFNPYGAPLSLQTPGINIPAPDTAIFKQAATGVFNLGNWLWPNNMGGCLNYYATQNSGTWKTYLSQIAEFCEYAGEYKIYEGILGASGRANPTEDFSQPSPWLPRCLAINNTVGPFPTWFGIDTGQMSTIPIMVGQPGTAALGIGISDYATENLSVDYANTVGSPITYDSSATKSGILSVTVPGLVRPITASNYTSFISIGNQSTNLYHTSAGTQAQQVVPYSNGGLTTVSYSAGLESSATSGIIGGFRMHTFREAVTGELDDHHVNGGWNAVRINLSGYTTGQVLYTELVYIYEDVPMLPDPFNACRPAQTKNCDELLAVLSDRGAFPIVTSGHSFFSNVKSALGKVGKGLSKALGFVETLGAAAALF